MSRLLGSLTARTLLARFSRQIACRGMGWTPKAANRQRCAAVTPIAGLMALLCAAAGCRAQPAPQQRAEAAPFESAEIRTLGEFGAVGDGRADDTAAVARALANSDRYCLDGEGRTFRVTGTLRADKHLCLRNVALVQAALPVNTSPYIFRSCPAVQDPSAVIDCKDPAIPADRAIPLWRSLSTRTLLIRPGGDRPIRVILDRVKVDRGRFADQGSRTDSAGIWLDGADGVDFRDVEITGNGKGYGLLITNARNVKLTNLWIHDLVWAPYPGDRALSQAEAAATGWNSVPIHEFREQRPGGAAVAKFYGVRIQEQLTCAFLANVSHVRIENVRIERCMARFDTGDLPWQTDGLAIGRSSSDVTINGARIDSTWEAMDVVGGGDGIDRLEINDLTVSNAFSFGLKMGYQLRGARISRVNVDGAGLAGVVLYGPVRDVRISRGTIRNVGKLRGNTGSFSPWPPGNRAGIRIDGATGAAPEDIQIEDIAVFGRPKEFEFGLLNTGGRRIRLVRFKGQGFGREQAHGINQAQ